MKRDLFFVDCMDARVWKSSSMHTHYQIHRLKELFAGAVTVKILSLLIRDIDWWVVETTETQYMISKHQRFLQGDILAGCKGGSN